MLIIYVYLVGFFLTFAFILVPWTRDGSRETDVFIKECGIGKVLLTYFECSVFWFLFWPFAIHLYMVHLKSIPQRKKEEKQ